MALIWETLNWESPLSCLSLTSSYYYGRFEGRDALFVHEGCLTSIFVFVGGRNSFCIASTATISAESEVKQINGDGSDIYMLSRTGSLCKLKNIIDESYTSSTLVSSQDGKWCWDKVQHFEGALAITGVTDGLAILRKIENTSLIEIYKKDVTNFKLHSARRICYSDVPERYYHLKNLKSKTFIRGIPLNEDMLYIDEPSGFFSVLPASNQNTQSTKLHFDRDRLMDVIATDDKNCILLAYRSGKIIIVTWDKKLKKQVNYTLFLPNKVVTAVAYDNLCLIWSNGFNLYHSKILNYKEIVHMKVSRNIKGVRHLFQIGEAVVAIAQNGCFYKIETDGIEEPEVVETNTEEVLDEILETSQLTEKISERIKNQEEMFYGLTTAQMENIKGNIILTLNGRDLQVDNKTDRVFKKKFWRVEIKTECGCKKKVILHEFEDDFRNNSSVSFHIDFVDCEKLIISLIGDFGSDFDVLKIELPRIEFREDRRSIWEKKLLEIQKENCK